MSDLVSVMQRLAALSPSDRFRLPFLYLGNVVATDNAALIMVPAAHYSGDRQPVAPPFKSLPRLDAPTWTIVADRAALRAWCGDPVWPAPGPCDECDGTGKSWCGECLGEGVCERCSRPCEACDDGKVPCSDCDGTWRSDSVPVPPRYATIGPAPGIPINRVLLARVLEAFAGETVEIAGAGEADPIRVTDAGPVVAMVMPVRGLFMSSERADRWEGAR